MPTVPHLFSNLMFQGRTKEALRLLSTKEKGTQLDIHSALSPSNHYHTVLYDLQAKHPPCQPTIPGALLHSPPSPPPSHPVIFECWIISKAILSIINISIIGTLHSVLVKRQVLKQQCTHWEKNFQDQNTEVALLVDTSNTFNNLNRHAALCPSLAEILHVVTTYRIDTQLIIDNSSIYLFGGYNTRWPTCHDDCPCLCPSNKRCQVSFQCQMSLICQWCCYCCWLHCWSAKLWSKNCLLGPVFAYFVNPVKTCLVVKEKHFHTVKTVVSGPVLNDTPKGIKVNYGF